LTRWRDKDQNELGLSLSDNNIIAEWRFFASWDTTEMRRASMKFGKLWSVVVSAFLLCMAATTAAFAQDNSQYSIANNKPGFISTAKGLGPEASSKQITIYAVSRVKKDQKQIPVE
jgi:hypothetical protein